MKLVNEKMGIWGCGIISQLFKLAFNEKISFENSDEAKFIIRSLGPGNEYKKDLPYITFSGESIEVPHKNYPPLFEISSKNIPYIISVFFELLENIKIDLNDIRLDKNNDRPYFLAYCASNPVPIREKMFKLLKHETAHGLGRCSSTPGKTIGEHNSWRENWRHYIKYRFVIAMENKAQPGYVTEKLLNALLAGSIPIYFGDPIWVKSVFNSKRIIFVQDFNSLEDCAKYILDVDKSPYWLNLYQSQPASIIDKRWFTNEHPEYNRIIKILRDNYKQLIVASEGMGEWCKDFFEHMALFRYNSVKFEKSERSTLILRSMFFHLEPPFQKKLPYVTWSGENFECPDRNYPPIYRIWSDYKIPFLVVAFFELQKMLNTKFDLNDLRLVKNNHRPYFLAYCASASYYHRETMFSLLKNHGISHALGKCQNNIGKSVDGTWHSLWKIYSQYKFVLTMENLYKKWYVTEKLLNGLLSGAIPIYYGDSEWVKRVFNEDCIIFVNDFSSFEECAEYIKKVDTTQELYDRYINAPRKVIDTKWFEGENEVYREMASKLI